MTTRMAKAFAAPYRAKMPRMISGLRLVRATKTVAEKVTAHDSPCTLRRPISDSRNAKFACGGHCRRQWGEKKGSFEASKRREPKKTHLIRKLA